MLKEQHHPQPSVPEVPSSSETALKDLNSRIYNVSNWLMNTFFQQDTWRVRQGGAYGAALLEVKGDVEEHDWEKEEQLVRSILKDLGKRVEYYGAAYHFPDTLWALGAMSSPSWLEMEAEDAGISKAEAASNILAKRYEDILEETQKFEAFLESDAFRQAFTITVDSETGEYNISDLHLCPVQMREQWNKLIPVEEQKLK